MSEDSAIFWMAVFGIPAIFYLARMFAKSIDSSCPSARAGINIDKELENWKKKWDVHD